MGLELNENAPEVLFRARCLSAEEPQDRKRIAAALADILGLALHQMRRDSPHESRPPADGPDLSQASARATHQRLLMAAPQGAAPRSSVAGRDRGLGLWYD